MASIIIRTACSIRFVSIVSLIALKCPLVIKAAGGGQGLFLPGTEGGKKTKNPHTAAGTRRRFSAFAVLWWAMGWPRLTLLLFLPV